MTQITKEAIEALEAARADILDAYRIWQADDVSAVPPPKSGAGSVIAKIDAVLSAHIAGQAKADDVFGDWWPYSPGKDGGQEVEAVGLWTSIKDAPRDGRDVLLTSPLWFGDALIGGFHFGAWRQHPDPQAQVLDPTHFMLIPALDADFSVYDEGEFALSASHSTSRKGDGTDANS